MPYGYTPSIYLNMIKHFSGIPRVEIQKVPELKIFGILYIVVSNKRIPPIKKIERQEGDAQHFVAYQNRIEQQQNTSGNIAQCGFCKVY